MALEAADDALVHWPDISYEIWFEIHNMNVLKTIWNDMSREIILQKFCGSGGQPGPPD